MNELCFLQQNVAASGISVFMAKSQISSQRFIVAVAKPS